MTKAEKIPLTEEQTADSSEEVAVAVKAFEEMNSSMWYISYVSKRQSDQIDMQVNNPSLPRKFFSCLKPSRKVIRDGNSQGYTVKVKLTGKSNS